MRGSALTVVVKIGTSSLTDDESHLQPAAIEKLCSEVALLRRSGHKVVVVTSAAIAAGLPAMGIERRPKDTLTLQAASAVGQSRLMRAYDDALAENGLVGGQILLTPNDFFHRQQFLHARDTLRRLIDLGVVPIVNENDAIADDEIRFGDNDRIAALVSAAVDAQLLVLLTDTPGVFTADPRIDSEASLIHEVTEVDQALVEAAGGAGTARGSGGMVSKLMAARMATWCGVPTVIAASTRTDVLVEAVNGQRVGTFFHSRQRRLNARKAWIAFALHSSGTLEVDDGAREAIIEGGGSLLAVGLSSIDGAFEKDDGVDVRNSSGDVFAKGVVRFSSNQLKSGRETSPVAGVVIHRDDLVLL